jgi:Protein of unknown function (DUF4231)
MSTNVAIERLDDQVAWYDNRSGKNERYYKHLKITVIVLASLIPLLSGVHIPYIGLTEVPTWVLGTFGALIAIIEGNRDRHHRSGPRRRRLRYPS